MAIKCKASLIYNRKLMFVTLFRNFICEAECKNLRGFDCIKGKRVLHNDRHESK